MSKLSPRKRQVVIYDPLLAKEIGLTAAILLERIRYLAGKMDDKHGWLNRSLEKMADDLGLNFRQLWSARDKLVELKLIEKRRSGNKLLWRPCKERIDKTSTRGLTKHQSMDLQNVNPLHINSISNTNTSFKSNTESKKTEIKIEQPAPQNALACINKNVIELPKPRKGSKAALVAAHNLLKAKYKDEFSELWVSYRKAFQQRIEPLGVKNNYGDRGATLLQYSLRREEGFTPVELADAIRQFYLDMMNAAHRYGVGYMNSKLHNWLTDEENIRDALETKELREEISVKTLTEDYEKLRVDAELGWQQIELKYVRTPGGKNSENETRLTLAREWVNYFNGVLERTGRQFAIEDWDGPVDEKLYIVSETLCDSWTSQILREYPRDAADWLKGLECFQRQSKQARDLLMPH